MVFETASLVAILACIAFVILGILNIIAMIVVSKTAKDFKGTSKQIDNVELVLDTIAEHNRVLKILFKIKLLRNIVKKNVAKGLDKAVDKAISRVNRVLLLFVVINISLACVSFALFNMFYTLHIQTKTAIDVIEWVTSKEEEEEESEETDTWAWESVTDETIIDTGDSTAGGDSDYSGNTSNSHGNATGTYAVQLDDGTYYWYHQNSGADGCTYCGDWSTAQWGRSGYRHSFGKDGCAVYSLAILASNLKGQEITPTDMIQALGCNVTTGSNGLKVFETDNSNSFTYSKDYPGKRLIAYNTAANNAANAFNMTVENISATEDAIDSILNKGGYVWTIFDNSKTKWSGGSSGTHFMAIRKKVNGQYYCFTSCRGKCTSNSGKQGAIDTMNYGINVSDVINSMQAKAQVYGFYLNENQNTSSGDSNGQTGGTGGGSSSITGDITSDPVYTILNSNYPSKAYALTYAYRATEPIYGKNFALGLMANMISEGNQGKIEGVWTRKTPNQYQNTKLTCSCHNGLYSYPYWEKAHSVHDIANSQIESMTKVDRLLNEIPSGTAGIGVGSIQWSGNRRVALLNLYKQKAKTFSVQELACIETDLMLQEFSTKPYNSVVTKCNGASPENCAKNICLYYEVPSNAPQKAVDRANTASTLNNLLSNY